MGVYSPMYSGIGGGGFMVVFKDAHDMITFNFRDTAPLAATQDMFVGKPNAAEKGGLSVAVAAHKRYGKVSCLLL